MEPPSSADWEYLGRWRAAMQLALRAGAAHPSLIGLVRSIEETHAAPGANTLTELRDRLGLGVEQQRLLASVLVDRGGRLSALDLCCIAWTCGEEALDWTDAAAQLDTLAHLGLVRTIEGPTADLRKRRHAAGPALAELARVARRLPRSPLRERTHREHLLEARVEQPAPAPDTAPAGAPASATTAFALRRWELELWAVCFRTRQALQRWILAHHDPFKEFVGSFARVVDAGAIDALAAEADQLEEELTTATGDRPRVLDHIQRTFELDPAHARVLLYFFLAEALDVGLPFFGRNVLAAIGPTGLTPDAIQELLGRDSPLLAKGLIAQTERGSSIYTSQFAMTAPTFARIGIDPSARPARERTARPSADVLGELREPRVALSDVILPATTHDALLDALALLDPATQAMLPASARARLISKGKGATLLFEGPPGTGKTMAAEALARHLGRPLYLARFDRIEDQLLGNSQKNVVRLFEEATRADAVLLLDEADALVARRTPVHQAWDQHRNTIVNLFLGVVEEHDGVVILTTNLAVNLDPALERRLTARVRFDVPDLPQREQLWRRYLDDLPIDGEVDVPRLARQYPMSGARIRNAALSTVRKELRRRVREGAAMEGGRADEGPLTLSKDAIASSAAEESRASYRDRTHGDDGADGGEIGELREPRRDLSSVVLPAATITRLREALVVLSPGARELLESAAFLDTFQTGRGVVLLFDGPPGTGKTMTAEAVAGELGRRLYVVTPERVLSKWHGQSERALARVFHEAQAMDAVLMIDEADSLLESRVDAHEWGARTSNNMVNLLLRRLDEASGVAILVTNRAARLDPALERRLTARLTFSLPDADQRAEILRRHVPADVRLAPDVDLGALARAHALSGGALRNAVLLAIRRMLVRDPRGRTLDRALLEEALGEARGSTDKRPIGFAPAGP